MVSHAVAMLDVSSASSRGAAASIPIGHGRRQKYSARSFYLVILAISIISVFSLLRDHRPGSIRLEQNVLQKRSLDSASSSLPEWHTTKSEECRLVHESSDQCAFVRANCHNEEAGLFSYLSLHYCRLPKAKPLSFVILVLWLALLFSTIGIAASDFFCINLSTISHLLGMSESLAGVTFLAFGNGSPDVFSTFAAMSTNSGSLAVGELIGAAGFITAVVGGSMALVRPFHVARKSFVRDIVFFIVAVSFSMGFLADGHLHLWECSIMVGFYAFYVLFVVAWHWWLGRRLRRRQREAAARGHFYLPNNDELQAGESNLVEDEAQENPHTSLPVGDPNEDFASLERGASPSPQIGPLDGEDEDEFRDRWMAEVSSNMRVSRPIPGRRRNTLTPIRPSLVGALEFRSVLSSLSKSRNLQTPISLRRYSDDANYPGFQSDEPSAAVSQPELRAPDAHLAPSEPAEAGRRNDDVDGASQRQRAKSASAASDLRTVDEVADRRASPQDLLTFDEHSQAAGSRSAAVSEREASPHSANLARNHSGDLLAPPADHLQRPSSRGASPLSPSKLVIPPSPSASGTSSAGSPFPTYSESPHAYSAHSHSRPPSIRLPPPSLSVDSSFLNDGRAADQPRRIAWWPYQLLPPPEVLASSLFPTLYSWGDKNGWERFLGIVACPSVFLLSITLPVVETERDDADHSDDGKVVISHTDEPQLSTPRYRDNPIEEQHLEDISPGATQPVEPTRAKRNPNLSLQVPGSEAEYYDDDTRNGMPRPKSPQQRARATQVPPPDPPAAAPREWNRWLVSLQTVTAPFFVMLVVWANSSTDRSHGKGLLKPALWTLLASFICLALLLLTTRPTRPPRWRKILCFVGFIVSITWISTIANEVVGVLKAFGVILGISDAILGLTIFAVGNSLGDLVADITVARLGFPVMALSACFGGPMLNILLGVGLSGLYITIREGWHRHDKHPEKQIHYKAYQIEVSSTLMISAATLLVTLVGLLVAVPLQKWTMTRRIGWGLIALWSASTVANVAVEIAGLGGKIS